MKTIFTSILLVCIFFQTSAQRNVLVIIADDLGTDYLSFYENAGPDTVYVPNIKSLLSKGVRFKNAMSNPVCSATRSGILTGRYSFRTGVGGIVGGIGGSNQLDTSEITIPRLLKKYNSNIAKADIGKWHLHQPAPASNLLNPNVMGYDRFEGPFIGQLPSFTNWTKYTNGVASNCTNYATSENVNNAVSWLKTLNTNKPFFLWLAFNAPHEPLHLPPLALHTYTNLNGSAPNINANPKSYFKAMIQAMDHEIGRLFDTLRVMNKMDSTDIIFIGDNGNTERTAQIANLTKAKGTIYQYGVHVPFIVSGPSVISPNRASDALVNTTDIFATVLELFRYNTWTSQIPFSKPVDSKSILPIIKNTATTIRPWSFCEIFKLITDSADGKAMRNLDYKLIRFDYGKEEFYNLTLDPLENNNLLTMSMTTTDISNYYYLCNEMTTLTGSGVFCLTGVDVKENNKIYNAFSVRPNPFSTFIKISSNTENEFMELINCYGQIIYSGDLIEKQNFSDLPNGIYFLKKVNESDKAIKLIKE
jgi:arylsulfatase A-like enzyme